MLVLGRKLGERIVIGDDVAIVVNRISGNRVSIGVEAPSDIKVIRGELKCFRDEFADAEAPDESTSSTLRIAGDLRASSPRTAR